MAFTKTQRHVINSIMLDTRVITSIILPNGVILVAIPHADGGMMSYEVTIDRRWVDVCTTRDRPQAVGDGEWYVRADWQHAGRMTARQFREWLRRKANTI